MSSATIVSPVISNPEVERPNPHSLKVIGAALPRTGSMSMYEAMNRLGLKCHHMRECFGDEKQIPLWTKAYRGENSPADWDELLSGYQATMDAPSCQFVKELAILNPEAKIIITTRNPTAWGKSLRSTVCWMLPGPTSWITWALYPQERNFFWFASEVWWGKKGIFAGKRDIDENAIIKYQNDLLEFFASRGEQDRILVYETRSDVDGYDVICPFLGIEKPEGAVWPNTNASTGSENSSKSDKTFEQITAGRMQIKKERVERVKKGLTGLGLVSVVGGVALMISFWQKGGFKR